MEIKDIIFLAEMVVCLVILVWVVRGIWGSKDKDGKD